MTGATANGVGAGKENTAKIIAKQGSGDGGNYAAKLCDEYSVVVDGVTYDDWYLPSKKELNLLYRQGGFANNYYWSSTEYDYAIAWYRYFGIGYQYFSDKYDTLRVRAVQAF